jgi:hypothetical protein
MFQQISVIISFEFAMSYRALPSFENDPRNKLGRNGLPNDLYDNHFSDYFCDFDETISGKYGFKKKICFYLSTRHQTNISMIALCTKTEAGPT